MARKSLKSPEERIAEAQALIARLEQEAAQADIASDPKLEPVRQLVESLKSERLVLMRGFANHAQNFANRRLAHALWIEEIDATQAHDRARIQAIESAIQQITSDADFLTGLDSPEVEDYMLTQRQNIHDATDDLRDQVLDAKTNRETFNAERKAPKRKPKEDAAEA